MNPANYNLVKATSDVYHSQSFLTPLYATQVDIFSHDLLIIPVHLGMHWCLACVDLRRKAVRYFDSMLGNNNRGLDAILRYLRDEHADKKKQPLDTGDWEAINEKVGAGNGGGALCRG